MKTLTHFVCHPPARWPTHCPSSRAKFSAHSSRYEIYETLILHEHSKFAVASYRQICAKSRWKCTVNRWSHGSPRYVEWQGPNFVLFEVSSWLAGPRPTSKQWKRFRELDYSFKELRVGFLQRRHLVIQNIYLLYCTAGRSKNYRKRTEWSKSQFGKIRNSAALFFNQ